MVHATALSDRACPNGYVCTGGIEFHPLRRLSQQKPLILPIGLPVSYQQLATPATRHCRGVLIPRDLAPDQIGDVPPLVFRGDNVEVVPLAPGGVGDGWNVEAIELVVELLVRGSEVSRIGRHVFPRT